ncbi:MULTISPECIES: hypothetical protein [Bacillus cereus group]|uniref:hypothetical protein n=1 Tax=Bacillus cereus group TaxID=86661 RepID=UPI0021CF7F63|nr:MULTISPECIES: hypothetical protein [Bacillus cereus group]MCU5201669.1 hypothetical protein [Bacillus paranthracis]MCU5374697.1 hypothetical protein [Bacillus pacificus]
MIKNEQICIQNGELIDFECDIENFHLYILVEKDKFLPYVHIQGTGFRREKRLPIEMKKEIQSFIERKNKELRLKNLFESSDCGEPGISSYLKNMITRDKFDYIRYILERDLKQKRVRLIELQKFGYKFDNIDYDLTITRMYDHEQVRLKLYGVTKGTNTPSFSYLSRRRADLVGEWILHIELIGMYHDKWEDTFIVRSIEEVREKKDEKTKENKKKRPGKRKKNNRSRGNYNNR